jgi:6-phosphogluconolactonase
MIKAGNRVSALCLLGALSFASAVAAPAQQYWMYVGSRTSLGGQGIYLLRFDASTGRVASAGLAAGRLWSANSDSVFGGLSRMFAQARAKWPKPGAMLRGVENPINLAVHPGQQYLYTADENIPGSAVSAFRIEAENGKLTLLNERPSGGERASSVTVDRTGKYALVSNYVGGELSVFPIDADGSLKTASFIARTQGQQAGGNAEPRLHSVSISPDNRFVIATDLALNRMLVYRFNAATGVLAPGNPAVVNTPPGGGARHFRFHPNGRFAYLVEEAGSSIVAMQWDAVRGTFSTIGTVSTLPPGFHGANTAAELLVNPNGRFVYASNRGHDSIAVFAVDQNNGTLMPIQFISCGGGKPLNMGIDPTGQYLFASNIASQNVVEFRIDGQTGRISPTGAVFSLPYPEDVRFAAVREAR